MNELKPIFLTEGLFQAKNNFNEVKYSFVVDTFKKLSDLFKLKLSKSSICRDIKVYTHGYPKIYMVGKKDYRGFPIYNVTSAFKVSDLAKKTGYSETIIINQIIDICNEINSDETFVKAGLYYSDETKERLQIRIYLDNMCLPDLTSRSGKMKVMSKDEVLSEINENIEEVVKVINKDDKIKQLGSLMMASTGENHLYFIHGGKVLVRQISITSYNDSTFSNFGLNSYSAGMNVKYYLNEKFTSNTNITLYNLFIDGKCFLFIGNNNKTEIK